MIWNSFAPKASASSRLDSVLAYAITSHPTELNIRIATWPSPPTPCTTIRSPGFMSYDASTSHIISPPHIRGAASLESSPSGSFTDRDSCHTAWLANEPTRSNESRLSQYCSLPVVSRTVIHLWRHTSNAKPTVPAWCLAPFKPYPISRYNLLHMLADIPYDPGAVMYQRNSVVSRHLIRAAESSVCDFNQGFMWLDRAFDCLGDDDTAGRAAEYGVFCCFGHFLETLQSVVSLGNALCGGFMKSWWFICRLQHGNIN